MNNIKNNLNKPKLPISPKGKFPKMIKKPSKGPLSVFSKIINAIFILLLISTLYSMVFTGNSTKDEISLSQLATDISLGTVEKIIVKGDSLSITYLATKIGRAHV